MKKFCFILTATIMFFNIVQSNAQGNQKADLCMVFDAGALIEAGVTCSWGSNRCNPNPCSTSPIQ